VDDNEHGAPSQGTKRTYPLEFKPPECKKSVKDILETLWNPADENALRPGFIYCFSDKFTPGYLKIGHTKIKENPEKYLDPQRLPCPEEKDEHVVKRLEYWEKKCGLDMDVQFATFMPCAAKRMEMLIHASLHNKIESSSTAHVEGATSNGSNFLWMRHALRLKNGASSAD